MTTYCKFNLLKLVFKSEDKCEWIEFAFNRESTSDCKKDLYSQAHKPFKGLTPVVSSLAAQDEESYFPLCPLERGCHASPHLEGDPGGPIKTDQALAHRKNHGDVPGLE